MRLIPFLILALAGAPMMALDHSSPVQPAEPLAKVPPDLLHIPAESAKILPLAEWEVVQEAAGEQTGERVLIREGAEAVSTAPADASRYEARAHKYPSGAVRILKWDAGSGPVIHQVTFETELFVLEGEVDVEVRGETLTLAPGDAAFLPSGVMRNMNPTGDTVIAQYFVGHTSESPAAQVVGGKDLEETRIVQWEDDGSFVTARTEKERRSAPANAATYDVRRYSFDGNSIRYAKLYKGGKTNPATYDVDVLIYIISGRMRRIEGDETFVVSAGDTVREKKGATGYWELLEDSEFIATNAPIDPAGPLASP